MRKTKFDIYFDIGEKLVPALLTLKSRQLGPVLDGFSSSLMQIKNWLNEDTFPTSKSALANGLEQGINELPFFIENMESNLRAEAFNIYYQT